MKKRLVCFLFFLMVFASYGQVVIKIYYNERWQVVNHPAEAAYYRHVQYDRHKHPIGIVRTFYVSGELEWDGKMIHLDPLDGSKYIPDGLCRWFYPNGFQSMEATFKNNLYEGRVTTWYKNRQKAREVEYTWGKPNGKWIEYYENGAILRQTTYKNGKSTEKWMTECDEFGRCQKVFAEDFLSIEASNADWPVVHHTEFDKQQYKIEFQEGRGLFLENERGKDLAQWIHLPLQTHFNFSIETTVHFLSGDPNAGYGLLWGFKDWDNYYYYVINAHGYYEIGAVSEGIHHTFSTWKYTQSIHQGISNNLLKINKVKDKLYFSVNRQVVEKQDFHECRTHSIGFITMGGAKKSLFKQLLVKQDVAENQIDPIELTFLAPYSTLSSSQPQSESAVPQSEIEKDIPIGKVRDNAIGIVLGIEDYKNIGKVSYALRDAETVKRYFVSSLGIPSEHLYYKTDQNVTKGEMEKLFGRGGWLDKRCDSTTEVFVYFVGHGAPSEEGKAYLIPYDGDPNYLSLSGYGLDAFFQDIGKLPAKNVLVMMDACFSGLDRETKMLLANTRSIGIKPKENAPSEKITLFSATSSTQSSIGWPEKSHGLFTFFLLAGLQGAADSNQDKKITVEELGNYVKAKVTKQAGLLDTEQTPQLKTSKRELILLERD